MNLKIKKKVSAGLSKDALIKHLVKILVAIDGDTMAENKKVFDWITQEDTTAAKEYLEEKVIDARSYRKSHLQLDTLKGILTPENDCDL